jgi:hypothetical protein
MFVYIMFSHTMGSTGAKQGKKAAPSFTEDDFPRLGKPVAKAQSDSESESDDDTCDAAEAEYIDLQKEAVVNVVYHFA